MTQNTRSLRKRLFKLTPGRLLVNVVLLAIVIIWTVPTIGLLVSSVRDADQLRVSGWWTALTTTERNESGRTDTAEAQFERDGTYVIAGRVIEEGDNPQVKTFGGGFLPGELSDYEPGTVVEMEDGTSFVLERDGSYEYRSPVPFELDRGMRFFYRAEIPPQFTLDNYRTVLASEGIEDAFINTFTVTIPSTVLPVGLAALAAYGFSWMKFPGRNWLFYLMVALIVVPLQMSLIPLLRLYNEVGLAKTYPGIWLAHTAFGLPLAIYILSNYIGGLPAELIDAARIDGASHFQIFLRIILPLSVPALASFSIFQFLWVWNDLLVALVFLGKRPDQIVLTSQLRELLGSRGDNWEILTSSAFVSMIVPLIVFFSLQRYFVRGLLGGSLKGG